ncbi:MAG: hypothetical protein LUF04_07165 [Bacteroides sp.]|nr:hypothetical protein [Bacteroides sp.]
MDKYDVNYKKLALLLLPTFLRKPVIAALAYAATAALNRIHTRFDTLRKDSDFRLLYNGQVCYLRAVLNQYFDPIQRRITITENADAVNNSQVFMRGLDQSQFLPTREQNKPLVINRKGLSGVNSYDFWINLPHELRDEIQPERLKAVTDTYRLASKRYEINYK